VKPTHRDRVVKRRFETIADTYDTTILRRRASYNAGVNAIVAERLATLDPRPGESQLRLLDAGCGTGTRWHQFAMGLPANLACGLDLSQNMCHEARLGGKYAGVVRASLTNIPFPDDAFDGITCLFFAFCYLTSAAQRQLALSEMRRVLRPGGLLFIDVINRWHKGEGSEYHRPWPGLLLDAARSFLDPRLRPGDKLYQTKHEGDPLSGYFHGFSGASFSRLLTSADLTQHQLFTIGYNSGTLVGRQSAGQVLACINLPDDSPGRVNARLYNSCRQ